MERHGSRMKNARIEDVTAYEIIEKREIRDIHSMSYLLRHKKTGARIALLENDLALFEGLGFHIHFSFSD